MSIAFVLGSSPSFGSCASAVSRSRFDREDRLRRGRGSYSMMLFALRRDGMAGVCGVCGEIGLPGDEAVDTDVPAIMAGTLDNWRLEDEEERCNIVEEETESESAACESLRR